MEILESKYKNVQKHCFSVLWYQFSPLEGTSCGHHWNWLTNTLILAPCKVKSDKWLWRYWSLNTKISKKNSQIICFVPIFTTRGAGDPSVIGTIETSLSVWFIWHLEKSNQTYGYGNINEFFNLHSYNGEVGGLGKCWHIINSKI